MTVRENTERPEAIDAGTVVLAGNTGRGLEATVERMMRDGLGKKSSLRRKNPYGDGRSSERILGVLANALGTQ